MSCVVCGSTRTRARRCWRGVRGDCVCSQRSHLALREYGVRRAHTGRPPAPRHVTHINDVSMTRVCRTVDLTFDLILLELSCGVHY